MLGGELGPQKGFCYTRRTPAPNPLSSCGLLESLGDNNADLELNPWAEGHLSSQVISGDRKGFPEGHGPLGLGVRIQPLDSTLSLVGRRQAQQGIRGRRGVNHIITAENTCRQRSQGPCKVRLWAQFHRLGDTGTERLGNLSRIIQWTRSRVAFHLGNVSLHLPARGWPEGAESLWGWGESKPWTCWAACQGDLVLH